MAPEPPPVPRRPSRDAPQPSSRTSLYLGVGALLIVLAISFALVPHLTTVVTVLFVIIALQYFLWGRWLGNLIRQEESGTGEEEAR